MDQIPGFFSGFRNHQAKKNPAQGEVFVLVIGWYTVKSLRFYRSFSKGGAVSDLVGAMDGAFVHVEGGFVHRFCQGGVGMNDARQVF